MVTRSKCSVSESAADRKSLDIGVTKIPGVTMDFVHHRE